MHDVKEELRDALDLLDGISVNPTKITCGRLDTDGFNIVVATCGDFAKACKAWSTTPLLPRHGVGGASRVYEVITDGPLLQHWCFPHLDCWGAS